MTFLTFLREEDENEKELPDENLELDSTIEPSDDPDRQGLVRFVDGAHLVYKRQSTDSTFTELWIYNIDKSDKSQKIKQKILAGTDIEQNQVYSPDRTQSYAIKTLGNAQLLTIIGLPQ